MYDPARDTWRSSGDRGESAEQLRHQHSTSSRAKREQPAIEDASAQNTERSAAHRDQLNREPEDSPMADTARTDVDAGNAKSSVTSPKPAKRSPSAAQRRQENTGVSAQDATLSASDAEPSLSADMDRPDESRTSKAPAGGKRDTKNTKDANGSPVASSNTTDHKRKLTEDAAASQQPDTEPSSRNPTSKRRRVEERHQKLRKRGRTPPAAYSRRDRSRSPAKDAPAPRQRSISPLPRPRSPTPEAQTRQRKRPGGGARMGIVDRETIRRRQEERDRAQEIEAQRALRDRGVADVVRQHYNAVPERGREWRKTESKIRGLRSFNNWVKSTIIQKFSPSEEFLAKHRGSRDWTEPMIAAADDEKGLLVVDLGCGKGGDLGKWQQAPQAVELYVGLDPAEISIEQARDRYNAMRSGRGSRGRSSRNPLFHAEFWPKDCFGEWLGDVRIVQQVGIDANVGPGGSVMSSRWGGGGFDVVATMFTMHYAFESEEKTRQMLRNVAGALKKGGRFLGVGPNSDVISSKVVEFHKRRKEREAAKQTTNEAPEDGEVEDEDGKYPEWGNSIYRVKFHGETPEDGIFRPPFGWKYSYFMEEAVEEIPEYVVPWEAFRALTEDYNLELQYRKPFLEIWNEEKDDRELGPLSERMGVRDRNSGALLMTDEEKEAASFYHAFCFYKV